MGLSRSLSTGASSLRAHQMRFDVISNNLANANTVAYKSTSGTFVEQFNQIYNYGKSPESETGFGAGGINPMQFGLGVKMGAVTTDMSQGVIESTNRPLDLALQGDGFFVYNLNGRELYSRAGAISLDKDGFLVDSATGAYVQGYNVDYDPNGKIIKDANGVNTLNSKVKNLQIPSATLSPPRQTVNASVRGNLNSTNPTAYERKTSINIYDQNGGTRSLGLMFTKSANLNEYSLSATLDGNAVNIANTVVTFNNDGSLKSPLTVSLTAAALNTALGTTSFDATTPKDITLKLADSNNILSGLTQYSMPNSVTASDQDGYKSGELVGLSVDPEGKAWGSFTNGQSEILGQVVMAKFTNPTGLVKQGDNFFSGSPNSGIANIGTAGEIFPSSKIASNSLEQSNVDMTTQFTDMISTQRAFEAAARTITVSDQLLAETNQLKR